MSNSGNTDKIDDIILASFVDGQLDAAQRKVIIEAMDNDLDLRERVYRLRKIKDLVKLGFEDANPPTNSQHSFKPIPFWRRNCAAIAASITALAISFGAGVIFYHNSQLSDPLASENVASINLEQPDRILLHISESDPRLFEETLAFAEKFLKKHKASGAKIEVVANAGGIDLMRVGYPLGDKVIEMMAAYDNVTFVTCANTIKSLQRQGIEPMIIKDVGTEKAAMDHIIDRVREGWTYIKARDAQKMTI